MHAAASNWPSGFCSTLIDIMESTALIHPHRLICIKELK